MFAALALLGVLCPAFGATIELAHKADGSVTGGIILEGEIEPGDSQKLLAIYEKYAGPSPVYLRSKGGNVEEAIKLGRLIRQLRLATEAPSRHDGEIATLVPAAAKDNDVCGSACFLVFAGGVDRRGDFLVLHRPYLAGEAARKLSDPEREAAQKALMNIVRDYLQEMEIDPFFIDKTMWTNSQDGYVTSYADVMDHHLDRIAPSIEEIVLSSCEELTPRERDQLERGADPTLRERILGKASDKESCKNAQLEILRANAWARQHEDELQAACGLMSAQDKQSLIAIDQTAAAQRSEADKQAVLAIAKRESERHDCRSSLLAEITLSAAMRYSEATRAQGVASATPLSGTPPAAAGLSADEMYEKGNLALKAKDYSEAMRWYSKAADHGNSRAMFQLSQLYTSGDRVARDDAEATRSHVKSSKCRRHACEKNRAKAKPKDFASLLKNLLSGVALIHKSH